MIINFSLRSGRSEREGLAGKKVEAELTRGELNSGRSLFAPWTIFRFFQIYFELYTNIFNNPENMHFI